MVRPVTTLVFGFLSGLRHAFDPVILESGLFHTLP